MKGVCKKIYGPAPCPDRMYNGERPVGAAKGKLVPQFFEGGGGAPAMAKVAKPAYQRALEKSLGIEDQSCPMLPLSHKAMW